MKPSTKRDKVIYLRASPALIESVHEWIDSQAIRPSISSTTEAALKEFMQNHPVLK